MLGTQAPAFHYSLHAPSRHQHMGVHLRLSTAVRNRRAKMLLTQAGKEDDDNPDWDKEMSIFNKRELQPLVFTWVCWQHTSVRKQTH